MNVSPEAAEQLILGLAPKHIKAEDCFTISASMIQSVIKKGALISLHLRPC
jgi:hypothetical protein